MTKQELYNIADKIDMLKAEILLLLGEKNRNYKKLNELYWEMKFLEDYLKFEIKGRK